MTADRSTGQTWRYLAYGSNLHPLRLTARTPSARLVGTDVIQGWQLVFHKRGQDGSGKCNIRPADGAVFAAVYELETFDMETLDAIEGVNRGYQRHTLQAKNFGRCEVYLAEQSHVDPAIRPFCWYRSLVLEGCRYHGFPDDYVAPIHAVDHVRDEDPARRGLHEGLLARMRGHTR
ncbi:MAG: gamma-glutamylcyclotransferase family protein [Pseudomonadota bacterium]